MKSNHDELTHPRDTAKGLSMVEISLIQGLSIVEISLILLIGLI